MLETPPGSTMHSVMAQNSLGAPLSQNTPGELRPRLGANPHKARPQDGAAGLALGARLLPAASGCAAALRPARSALPARPGDSPLLDVGFVAELPEGMLSVHVASPRAGVPELALL